MNVLITGGGGFLGGRLARAILARGSLVDRDGQARAVGKVRLFDTAFPAGLDPRLTAIAGDISRADAIEAALAQDTDVVFHLAAVVSGGAEADFDAGMRVNFAGTHHLLEACRKLGTRPQFFFASSVAAFGGELPAVVDDRTTPNPQSSYGAQKVIGEYLVADYARKGFIDGVSLRLPTIVVRPGKPNLAASSFASSVIREPLAGAPSICPVPDSTGVWLLSPPRVIDALMHAQALPRTSWGVQRVVNLPGITVTVREMIDSLARLAGSSVAARVGFSIDSRVQAIVETWPTRFRTDRANALGFVADRDFDEVVRAHMSEFPPTTSRQ